MPDGRSRTVLLAGAAVLLAAATALATISPGQAATERSAGSAPLPRSVQGSPAPTSTTSSTEPPTVVMTPDVGAALPVAIDLPFASSHHPNGVQARVVAHRLTKDGALFVPADPREVAWASSDAKVGSDRGTAILAGHINYVINGQTVIGAFADLAEYAAKAVGKVFTVRASDGRMLRYRVVAGRQYTKNELASRPHLRTKLFDQTSVYGPVGHPSGRLLLVSCGGPYDPNTGEYEDNVFLYALPVIDTPAP
jgi:hypothetical protein